MENLVFQFRDLIFNGLRFKISDQYSDEDFDRFTKDKTHYNKIRYRDAIEELTNEQIHIKLSFSLLLNVMAYVSLFIAIVLSFNFLYPALTILLLGFCFKISSFLYRRRANQLYIGKVIVRDLIDLIFDE